jgi:hypothetical protein
MDDRHFRERTEADFKAWDEAQKRKLSAQQSLMQEIDHLESSMRDQYYQSEGSTIDRQKEMALQGLSGASAQTVREKQAVEDQKFAIESFYAEKSLALQLRKLTSEHNLELGRLQALAAQAGPENQGSYDLAINLENQKYANEADAMRQSTSEKEIIDAQKTAKAKADLQIDSAKSVYQNLKQQAGDLFDQMVYHTKTWGDFFKGIVKTAVMTPIKDIFSSQLAGVLTKGITGQDVTWGEVGSGQGAFGKLGGIFGRAGLGQPKFGDANHPLAKLNAPNHLGDVSLVSGAVPVVIVNSANPMSPAAIATRAVQDAARPGWHVLPFKIATSRKCAISGI